MDSEKMGEKIHKLEMLEMDFLRKNGINPNYNEVENHIEKLFKTCMEDVLTLDDLGIRYIEYEEMVSDLEDKCNAIDSASANLSDLNRFVKSMRKSELRTNIMDCIERMKLDLC